MRGFWIGAVGLRSVQDKINLDKLGYSTYFTQKLKSRVPSLDRMLEKLDTLSSVIFSFTFLIVFMFFSMFLYFATISLFAFFSRILIEFLPEGSLVEKIAELGLITVLFLLLIGGLIYAFDTLSIGFLKKYKWTSKIFFPIYKFIGWITLANIYRSIYYSLVSRFSKRKTRVALTAYLLLFFFFPFIKFDQYIYFPDNGQNLKMSSNEYDSLREEDHYIYNTSIPSQIVKGSFLPLFIRYRVSDNKVLRKICPEFSPEKNDGFNSGISIGSDGIKMGEPFIREKNPEKILACFESFYELKMDSTKINTDFYFYTHPNAGEKGLQTMINIEELSKGKHEIFIQKKQLNRDEEIIDTEYESIVFWKE